jgi:hypothetical protein
VKQASSYPRKIKRSTKTTGHKKPDGRSLLSPESTSHTDPMADSFSSDQMSLEQTAVNKIKQLPKEVGVMLITAGILGLLLPGPGTPAIIAGGLALWPDAFGRLESWLERRHPGIHRQSMKQIHRFLDDLEKRYPYSTPG